MSTELEKATDRDALESEGIISLRLIPHNMRLVEARKKAGYTQEDVAERLRWSIPKISHIETLKKMPTALEMQTLVELLDLPQDQLFPPELLEAIEAGVFDDRYKELEPPEIMYLTDAAKAKLLPIVSDEDMIQEVDRKLLRENIDIILNELKPRESLVLTLRFGLDDGVSRTLEEVAQSLGVTRERVRQIEAKTLRLLRHPSRSRRLKDYLD